MPYSNILEILCCHFRNIYCNQDSMSAFSTCSIHECFISTGKLVFYCFIKGCSQQKK